MSLVAVALLAIVGGCNDTDPATTRAAGATKQSPCRVGERPGYFVPGPDAGEPLAVIGCARLGVSGKPVEFSANAERIGRQAHVCVNPAYRGRGQLGIYIPAICPSDPVARHVEAVGVEVLRQAVQRYQLVIWGTAGAPTREVVARDQRGEGAAAVFTVGPRLAQAVGATRPFSVFVVELAPEAACRPILVRAEGRSGPMTERIGARPKLCKSA